jgi:L-aminopeptidase/D-esterase-like protein
VTGLEPCVAQRIDPPLTAVDGRPLPVCGAPPGGAEAPAEDPEQGSIIIVVATDAPLSPDQLKRVVRRVALGMGRMGSINGNGSGDIFLAFSTANRGVDWGNSGRSTLPAPTMQRLGSGLVDPLFTATVEATEEAIINAMLAAETMTGADYRRAWALPHDQVKAILAKYNRLQRR